MTHNMHVILEREYPLAESVTVIDKKNTFCTVMHIENSIVSLYIAHVTWLIERNLFWYGSAISYSRKTRWFWNFITVDVFKGRDKFLVYIFDPVVFIIYPQNVIHLNLFLLQMTRFPEFRISSSKKKNVTYLEFLFPP